MLHLISILKKITYMLFKIVIGLVCALVLIILICFLGWQYDKYTTIKKCMGEGHDKTWCEALWQELDELD